MADSAPRDGRFLRSRRATVVAGLVLGVTVGTLVGNALSPARPAEPIGDTPEPPPMPISVDGFSVSKASLLNEAREVVRASGGALIRGHIGPVDGDETSVRLRLDAVLWETDGQDSLYAGSLVDLTVAPGSSDLDVLAGVEGSEVIALATADARLLGVAPLGADGTLAGPFSAGLFYLADMGNAMASSRYTNRADADSCGPSATSALEQTPVEALVNYFGANGGAT